MEIPRHEYWRKAVHLSGLFFIPILLWKREVFVALAAVFLAAYLAVEFFAKRGKPVPLFFTLADKSKRHWEKGRVSRGALLLVLSCFFLPYLLGPWAAAVGLSQAFAADATSTLAGLKWGRRTLPWAPKKTWMGSLVYFLTALAVCLFFVDLPEALTLALVGAAIESLPFPEVDNLTVPLAVGLAARFWP